MSSGQFHKPQRKKAMPIPFKIFGMWIVALCIAMFLPSHSRSDAGIIAFAILAGCAYIAAYIDKEKK